MKRVIPWKILMNLGPNFADIRLVSSKQGMVIPRTNPARPFSTTFKGLLTIFSVDFIQAKVNVMRCRPQTRVLSNSRSLAAQCLSVCRWDRFPVVFFLQRICRSSFRSGCRCFCSTVLTESRVFRAADSQIQKKPEERFNHFGKCDMLCVGRNGRLMRH